MHRCILHCALLWILEAVRDSSPQGLELDEETSDDCKVETNKLKQLLEALGYQGHYGPGGHCTWPGVTCDARFPCRVAKLECHSCPGALPEILALESLYEVSLTSPKLTGDLKAFSKLPQLLKLHLQGTEVSGHLTTLKKLKLEDLDLSGTQVTGRLEDLQNMDLVRLKLSKTHVTGDLLELRKCWKLRQLDLSFTRVTGRLTKDWTGRGQHLETLQLRSSSVHFVPEGEDLMELSKHWSLPDGRSRLLPRLMTLDLTNCPVNSTLEDLLMPLAMSPLASIKASGAGISGAVPQLKDVDAEIDFVNRSGFTFPMTEQLLVLDLSSNDVSELGSLPVVPLDGRIGLNGNQRLVVSPQVLRRAWTDQISLDLSGTELVNRKEVADLLAEGAMKTTKMCLVSKSFFLSNKGTLTSMSFWDGAKPPTRYVNRNETGGYTCKDLVGTVKVTPHIFLPEELCSCLPGWYGKGTTCHQCAADTFSDQMGLGECKKCPANSTATVGSTKLKDCKCLFGDLHNDTWNATCACSKHQTLQDGTCILCSRLHLQCKRTGTKASTALPDIGHMRLQPRDEEARKCLPPEVSQRCPGSHQCGRGYSGTLCSTCAEGFWASGGKCKPCVKASAFSLGFLVLLGVAAVLVAALLGYRRMYGQQAPRKINVQRQLGRLIILQAPVLLQMVQLWSVLSGLGQRSPSGQGLFEVPYLEILQLTTAELQKAFQFQCSFDGERGETVRTLAALSSPLALLLILLGCSILELCRAGLGVKIALRTLTLLFIGGASSAAELLSCQYEDGDGESLGDFAFRKSIRHLRCYKADGVGFWVNAVSYSSAVAYGILIPLFLAGLMLRQYFALQQARLFCACAYGEHGQVTLRLEGFERQIPNEVIPKRLLAAAAAHMAVHCRGKRQVQLHDGCITTTSENDEVKKTEGLDIIKVVADAEASRNIDMLRRRRLTEMLIEQILLEETEDRLLIGSQSLLYKYTLSQDVWMEVAMKLFAVALVSCVSMPDAWKYAWKWAIAFSLGMAVLVGTCQPYRWPQVNQLQILSCFCLALASLAFVYDCAWLARVTLLAPVLLLLWQVRFPDCTEALAERLYQELQSQLPKLQAGENHEVLVQQLTF